MFYESGALALKGRGAEEKTARGVEERHKNTAKKLTR